MVIYDRVIRPVIWSILRDHPFVDECVQDTWLKVLDPKLDLDGIGNLRGWLYRTARNQAIENLRHYRKWETLDLYPHLTAVSSSTYRADPFLREELRAAVDALPVGMRRVFLMRAVIGYSHAEIARRTGIRPVTSRSQFFKARAKLKEALGEKFAA